MRSALRTWVIYGDQSVPLLDRLFARSASVGWRTRRPHDWLVLWDAQPDHLELSYHEVSIEGEGTTSCRPYAASISQCAMTRSGFLVDDQAKEMIIGRVLTGR
jgi:hypothetical protein